MVFWAMISISGIHSEKKKNNDGLGSSIKIGNSYKTKLPTFRSAIKILSPKIQQAMLRG